MYTGCSARTGLRLTRDTVNDSLMYHRLSFADAQHSGWKSVAEGILSFTLYFVVLSVLTGLLLSSDVLATGLGGACAPPDIGRYPTECEWLRGMAGTAIWLPLALLCRALLGPAPLGLIWSVVGQVRWRLFFEFLVWALAVFLAIEGGRTLLGLATGLWIGVQFEERSLVVLGLLAVLMPFQVVAEEVVFRGYILQTIGCWLARPALVVLVPVPFFVMGHPGNVTTGIASGIMALAAGYLCLRTGGLEAAIALHLVNNLAVSGFSLVTEYSPQFVPSAGVSLAINAITMALFCAIVSFRMEAARWSSTRRVAPRRRQGWSSTA